MCVCVITRVLYLLSGRSGQRGGGEMDCEPLDKLLNSLKLFDCHSVCISISELILLLSRQDFQNSRGILLLTRERATRCLQAGTF